MTSVKARPYRRGGRFVAGLAGFLTLILLAFGLWPVSLDVIPEAVRFGGRLHPVLVHLPIGFLVALLVLEMVDLFIRSALLHHATYIMAWLAAGAALLAVVAGVLLALPGGYSEELLFRHRWLGVLTAVGAIWMLAWKITRPLDKPHGWSFVYHPLLLVTAGFLGGAGHYGGSLTHGSDYLTAYMPNALRSLIGVPERVPAEAVAVPDDPRDTVVFAALVDPIFQTRCVSCHGPERQRGGLRLDSHDLLVQGGESGPDTGLIARSLRLPIDDDRRMPPRDRTQLTADEIAIITWWVRSGADEHARVRDLEKTAVIERVLKRKLNLTPEEDTVPMREWDEIASLVETLGAEMGVRLQRVERGSDALEIPFLTPDSGFGDEELARLAPVEANMVTLNIGRGRITDDGMEHIGRMKNLTRLDLSNTQVSDAGLIHLAELPRLEYLNLYGTKITDGGLKPLQRVSSLRRIYLWQTGVTDEGLATLYQSLRDEARIEMWREEIRHLERMIEASEIVIDLGHGDSSGEAGATGAADPVNGKCPVSGRPVDPQQTVEHGGRLIAFCCRDCRARFDDDPDPILAEIDAGSREDD